LSALELAKQKNLKASIRDSNELLFKISEAEGNLSKSHYYFKQYILYKDSIQNQAALSNIEGQLYEFEIKKKETEIALLKKDGELKAQVLSARTYQLVSSGVILVLAVLLLVLFIRNYFVQRKINKLLVDKNAEIDLQSREILNKNDELVALNEEIISQQDEVIAQRDALEIKNQEIAHASKQIKAINENLEQTVLERTSLLQKQNMQLTEYAFINAHKLRAPLASILGLINMMMTGLSDEEQKQTLIHLKKSSEQLDEVVHSISSLLQEGIKTENDSNPKPSS
jgi:signal transduction histidine kinase